MSHPWRCDYCGGGFLDNDGLCTGCGHPPKGSSDEDKRIEKRAYMMASAWNWTIDHGFLVGIIAIVFVYLVVLYSGID